MTLAGDLGQRASVRQVLSWALVAALCVAAATAIVAILSGDFDDTDGRVIGSSVGFAVFSATAASGASLRFRPSERLRSLGLVTVALSIAAFALLLVAVWGEGDSGAWRWFVSIALATLACSHASLVSGSLRADDGQTVEWLAVASIGLALVDAFLGILAVTGAVDEVDDAFGQLLAVLVIFLVLTTALAPVLRRLQRPAPATGKVAGAQAAGKAAGAQATGIAAGSPAAGNAAGRPPGGAEAPLSLAVEVVAAAERIESLNADPGNRAAEIRRECQRLRQLAQLYER